MTPEEILRRHARNVLLQAKADGNRAWAERILTRHALGDSVLPIALSFARQALGERAERQPGEDDELN